jgi:hypothetical protein
MVILLARAFYLLTLSIQSKKWPMIQGKVEEVEIKKWRDEGLKFKVCVQYSYVVSGVRYMNNNLAFGYVASWSEKEHLVIYEKLKKSENVKVRYSPNKHSNSALGFVSTKSQMAGFLIPAIIMLFFTLVFFDLRNSISNRPFMYFTVFFTAVVGYLYVSKSEGGSMAETLIAID